MIRRSKFGISLRFVPLIFIVTILSTALTFLLGFISVRLNILTLSGREPITVLLLLVVASFIIGLLFSFFSRRGTSKFFKELDKIFLAIEQIGQGNFEIKLESNIKAPIFDSLIKSINKMTEDVKQKFRDLGETLKISIDI